MVKTLKRLSDLREAKYGQPHPRHGLNLLWWFAHDCVQIDSNGRMSALCNPKNGDFGFRLFKNKEPLLPYCDPLYYKLGNLKNAGSLPDYVKQKYDRHSHNSNKDRIIVSFDPQQLVFENVYVTQHSDRVNFDQNRTYCISTELIKDIQDLRRKNFIKYCMKRSEHTSINIPNLRVIFKNKHIQDNQDLSHEELLREDSDTSIDIHQSEQTNHWQSFRNEHIQDNQDLSHEKLLSEDSDTSIDIPQSEQPSQRKRCCCVLIGCSLLVVLLIIAVTLYLLLKT